MPFEVKLTVVGGKASKPEVKLKLPTTMGRSRECKLAVTHPMVSRKHCELYEADGLLMIRDLGSLNGTFMGDQQVREAPLPPEAEFTIGPLTFRVSYEYSGDLADLPPIVHAEEESQAAEVDKETLQHPATGSDGQSLPELEEIEPEAQTPPPAPKAKQTEQLNPQPPDTAEPAEEELEAVDFEPVDEQQKKEAETKSPDDAALDDFLKGI